MLFFIRFISKSRNMSFFELSIKLDDSKNDRFLDLLMKLMKNSIFVKKLFSREYVVFH